MCCRLVWLSRLVKYCFYTTLVYLLLSSSLVQRPLQAVFDAFDTLVGVVNTSAPPVAPGL